MHSVWGADHCLATTVSPHQVTLMSVSRVQLIGGGVVPLSHALCCRPCLPAGLPGDSIQGIGVNDTALAIVSLGCHASAATGAAPVPDCMHMSAVLAVTQVQGQYHCGSASYKQWSIQVAHTFFDRWNVRKNNSVFDSLAVHPVDARRPPAQSKPNLYFRRVSEPLFPRWGGWLETRPGFMSLICPHCSEAVNWQTSRGLCTREIQRIHVARRARYAVVWGGGWRPSGGLDTGRTGRPGPGRLLPCEHRPMHCHRTQ